MSLNNLFIFNSKSKQISPVTNALRTVFWFIFFLILLDTILNLLFPYPSDPLDVSPSQLSRYFDYGRSVEAKVRRQIGPTDQTSSPLSRAGWLNSDERKTLPTQPDSGSTLLLATYGMSFSSQVSEAVKEIDPHVSLRLIAGPTAPPNFSFTAYNLDRKKHNADVVILGVLASSLSGMDAITGMNWNPDVPPSYTFPKYYIKDGNLKSISPEINSLEELRKALKDKQKWQKFVAQMSTYDRFFNSFIFTHNVLDHSSMIRLIRRGWQQKHIESITNKIHTAKGFNPKWDQIPVLKAIIKEFTNTAKADGRVPIVLLLNDQKYDDHLFKILQTTLEENNIIYVSSHKIAPATNLKNFVGDGHFTKEANLKIAQEVLNVINKNLAKPIL
ncbi:hypothetical protein [Aphanothece sacrum]|uniref:Uncharacterized protein n=1 Tax=Aphanothece sacrum FPU1 TaxID=1920663 RepID=A0A401IHR8_APHSA|nr:hypothetical protein [Aphanothece sacrum]GBF80746.1 hypothetical protein AsFPU1_2151 [Aphanothece sacrum FPU1]GBF83240.1 hypothetical protein AsFPU3_0280 [Aphanothece sacrum FPU3]